MKKLNLNLDALQVESFATAGAQTRRAGTVRAHAGTEGGDTCATDAVGTWCCWTMDTQYGGGGDDSWYCGDDRDGPSHMASCGVDCDITGYVYKCANYTEIC